MNETVQEYEDQVAELSIQRRKALLYILGLFGVLLGIPAIVGAALVVWMGPMVTFALAMIPLLGSIAIRMSK